MSDKALIAPEAEAAILGAMMINNALIDRASDRISGRDFGEGIHAEMFERISLMYAGGKPVNPVSLAPFFRENTALADLGGLPYLAKLTADSSGVLAFNTLLEQVEDMARRRKTLAALDEARAATINMTCTERDVAAAVENAVQISGGGTDITEVSAAGAVRALFESYEGQIEGVRCGCIPELDDLFGTIRRKQMVILGGRPGMGKAQPLDAKVLTPTGWKQMGDIRVGDQVVSIDGAPSEVTGVFPQGVKQTYRMTFSDGRSTECCAEHLWKVRYRDWPSDRILPTEKLIEMMRAKRYANRLSIDLVDADFGGELAGEIDPWLMGVLLGDGGMSGLTVKLTTPDREIIERVRGVVPKGVTISQTGEIAYSLVTPAGAPNPVTGALRRYGLLGKRSEDKFIPECYMNASREVRLEIVRGLMDTDGWVEKHGTVRFCTSSKVMAEQFQYLIRSLGGLCKIKSKIPTFTYRGQRKLGLRAYCCTIRHEDATRFVTLAKKKDRVARPHNTSVRLNIASIEPVEQKPCQCISVSHPSRLYVTDDFIVTHNTALAISYAAGAAKQGHGVLFVSLEMGATELAGRLLANWSYDSNPIPYAAIQDGRLTAEDRHRLRNYQAEIEKIPLQIVDASSITVGRLNMLVRRWKRRFEARGQSLDLVIVDYLQLLRSDRSGQKRYEEVTDVSMAIKGMAKEHDVGLMVLAQLNREVEARDDKTPRRADLRDSGQLEQDADMILFVMREAYYYKQKEPPKGQAAWHEWMADYEAIKDKIDFILAKRRNGPEGTAVGTFSGQYQAVRGSK